MKMRTSVLSHIKTLIKHVFLFNYRHELLMFFLYYIKNLFRALGFAATRGKLYSRHPDLFKVEIIWLDSNFANQ